jgi:predicted Zn-dependent protease
MKCPQCSSDLNLKELVPLPRPGNAQVALCAFCGCFVSPDERGVPCVLAACEECGAPMDESPSGADPRCATCAADAASAPPAPAEVSGMGARILREALRLYPPQPPDEHTAYFDQVLRSLSDEGGDGASGYRLFVTDGLGFRALSIPGGTILVGSELLAGLEDEAMLAFALSREIAHQESGRVLRRYRSRRDSWALLATLEWGLGVLTRGAFSTGRGEAAIVREVARLGFGPVHEPHADESALRRISATGYDPAGAIRYLATLEKRHLAARGVLAAFLDSHPARSRRRCLAETLLAIGGDREGPRKVNRDAYRRAAARFSAEREELVRTGPAPPLPPSAQK